MPHFPNVGDRLQLRVWTQDTDQAAVNTFYFNVFSVTNTPSDQDVADYFAAQLAAPYAAILANTAFFQGVQVRIDNRLPLPVQADATPTFPVAGTAGAIPMSRQSCGLATWRTDTAGPRGRGRTYWPFPATADTQATDQPTGGYITRVGDITAVFAGIAGFVVITAGANTISLQHQLYSRKYHLMEPLVGGSIATKWATLRKRGSYGRQNSSPI